MLTSEKVDFSRESPIGIDIDAPRPPFSSDLSKTLHTLAEATAAMPEAGSVRR
jgi:hypothetical protein